MMKIYNNPTEGNWTTLCRRPALPSGQLDNRVRLIMERVRQDGDTALKELAYELDGVRLDELRVSEAELATVPADLQQAIARAADNIRAFHEAQCSPEPKVNTMPGVCCWRQSVAIDRVGLYIPGGSAPLFSTILMLVIPAQLAGCTDIVLCTPCAADGSVHPAILYTARFLGIRNIYKVGGAQAIAAMAYGTDTIPRVDKIFGPGNQYVTRAKSLLQQDGIAIDMPAGPSEVLVIADKYADPAFVAADLLSQAEHGADSQVVLLSDDAALITAVQSALQEQLQQLPRRETAAAALLNSFAVLLDSIETCLHFSNTYAPEHLIVAVEDASKYCAQVSNAGSVFLGPYTCESAGDYASGTNHTLPTNGWARSYSGVSVDSFTKKISFQEISADGLRALGPVIATMAAAEQLEAHKQAVLIRLNKLDNES